MAASRVATSRPKANASSPSEASPHPEAATSSRPPGHTWTWSRPRTSSTRLSHAVRVYRSGRKPVRIKSSAMSCCPMRARAAHQPPFWVRAHHGAAIRSPYASLELRGDFGGRFWLASASSAVGKGTLRCRGGTRRLGGSGSRLCTEWSLGSAQVSGGQRVYLVTRRRSAAGGSGRRLYRIHGTQRGRGRDVLSRRRCFRKCEMPIEQLPYLGVTGIVDGNHKLSHC